MSKATPTNYTDLAQKRLTKIGDTFKKIGSTLKSYYNEICLIFSQIKHVLSIQLLFIFAISIILAFIFNFIFLVLLVIALIVVLIDMIYFIIYKLKGPPEIDFDSLSEQVSYFIQGTIETQTTQIQSTLQKQHDKSLLALQQEYNSLSSSLQNEVRLHQIVYGMHIILNESLNHFELNVSPIILEKYFIDEDLFELIKNLTKNITIIEEKFFTHLENELDIPSIILLVLYRVQQGQAVSYEDILSSPDLMKKYSDIILNHELMKGLNCTDVMLNEIIGIEKTLDFSKLLEGVKYLTKVLRITRELISKLEEYKIKLEYQIYLKLILTNKNDLLARESNNLDLNLYI